MVRPAIKEAAVREGACGQEKKGGDTTRVTEGEPSHNLGQIKSQSQSQSEANDGTGTSEYTTNTHAAMAAFSAQDLASAMCLAGVEARAGDPRIIALANQGICPETVAAACEEARRARPDERIGPAYVVRIVERWAKDAASIAAHGAVAHGRAKGGVHAERKRVMEGLTGWRGDGGLNAIRTIEGCARFVGSSPVDNGNREDGDGFTG